VEGGAFRVLQIKEKFGTLRFYWDGDMSDAVKAKVEEAIAQGGLSQPDRARPRKA
jgi:hypothetical protein